MRVPMTSSWTAGSHAVQFYENEPFIHHAIAEFFTQGVAPGDPLILVSRVRTFTAVAGLFAAGGNSAIIADRIQFIDVEAVLSRTMKGDIFDQERAERLFKDMLSQVRPGHTHGTMRLYGETVDVLCQHGQHATALKFEALANTCLDLTPGLSILCGYAVERFKDDTNAARFRAVCQKHSHVIPAGDLGATTPGQTIYVIDDNAGLRRALGRLLMSSGWPVRTFDTAEAFLAEVDKLPEGCLVIDVQLPGASGLHLISQLKDAGLFWPIIVMSGLKDKKTESEALRLGARAYLRKPFDSNTLLDVITQALS